ncbi:hypothetical protein ACM71K_30490 [Pseudomonas aeruginosa]
MKTLAKCLMVLVAMAAGASSVWAEESATKIMQWEKRANIGLLGASPTEEFTKMVEEQPTAADPRVEEPMPSTAPRLLEEEPQQEGWVDQSRH